MKILLRVKLDYRNPFRTLRKLCITPHPFRSPRVIIYRMAEDLM